jgi:hypothetical protein
VCLVITSFKTDDTSDWTLQKNENGIKVYTKAVEGTGIKEVRVVNKVKSSLSGMVALLLDSRNYTNWIYECTVSRPLKVVSEIEMYNYQVTDFPWPVSDRDLICNFKITQDPVTKIVSFIKTGIPEYIPEKDSYVRIKNFLSSYKLTPLSDDSVKVELEMRVDPGGGIPTWLINANIVMAPYKSTVTMLDQIPKYQSASYSFIKEIKF